LADDEKPDVREARTLRSISYLIQNFFARIKGAISRPVTAIVLGLCFGISFWAIPFFVVANYRLLPVVLMNIWVGVVGFFSVWGSMIAIFLFVLGFLFGVLLLYSTSPSASY
jgi:hypothetical protein